MVKLKCDQTRKYLYLWMEVVVINDNEHNGTSRVTIIRSIMT
jgi:hypothetical protein